MNTAINIKKVAKSQDVTLANIGVSKMESSRLQKIAAIPETNVQMFPICKMPKLKEFVGHGNFVKWIENNLDISRSHVAKYIKLYEYQDKCSNLLHLQDAYKQIETIEAQAK